MNLGDTLLLFARLNKSGGPEEIAMDPSEPVGTLVISFARRRARPFARVVSFSHELDENGRHNLGWNDGTVDSSTTREVEDVETDELALEVL